MKAQTLTLVLLRLLAIHFLLGGIAALSSQIPMVLTMKVSAEDSASLYQSILGWTTGILFFSKILLSILLLVFSRKIIHRIIGDTSETLENDPQLPVVLTHVGILLIGCSALLSSFPQLLTTSIQWFRAHVTQPEEMADLQNDAMAETTLLFILTLFLILRGKTLTYWIFRYSK